jgi:hypothetical protein
MNVADSPTRLFESVRVMSLRAAQLMQGCRARGPPCHRAVLTARREYEAGEVQALPYGTTPAAAAGHDGPPAGQGESRADTAR